MSDKTKKLRLSTSKWALRFSLDRATVRKRFAEAEIEPVEVNSRETVYELAEEDAKEILLSQTRPIDAAKLRKETADADLREIKVKKELGELASVSEFTAVIQSVFGNLHKKCGVQMPKAIAKKLVGKKQSEISKIIGDETDRIFQDLRNDYKKFLDPELLEEDEL